MINEKTNFKLGDRVMAIHNSKRRYGTIRTIGGNAYETIAVVKFETEKPDEYELEKVKVSDIILAEETEVKKSEPVEKSEITITPDEFRETGVIVIKKLTDSNPLVGLAFTTFLAELHKALFFAEVSENS